MYSLTKHLLLLSLSHVILMTPELKGSSVTSAPQEATTTSDPKSQEKPSLEQSIAFTPPTGWMMADIKKLPPSVKIMVVGEGKTDFPPSINLGLEAYSGTLKQYIKTIKAINSSQGSCWKELGTLTTAVGIGNLYQEDTMTKWGCIRMMHLVLQKENNIYMMTAAATKEEFPSFYRLFFDSMRSLRFIDNVH
jgi:hypothetical protein